jgi:hypothetical protein
MFDALLELKRRRMMAAMPQAAVSVQLPEVGPDITPSAVPVMQPMQFQPVEMGGGSDAGSMAGLAIGQGVGHLLKERSPELKTPPGGNPIGQIPQKGGGHKFLGLFAEGGSLRERGDVAVVGDGGPELAMNVGRGETQIIPFGGGPSFDAIRRLGRERVMRVLAERIRSK